MAQRLTTLSALLLLTLAGGCTNTIMQPADVADPVSVYVLDHGRTPSLVIPDSDGSGMVRYAYGDWNWYALGNRGFGDAVSALLWPTRGALGRRELAGPIGPEALRGQVKVGFISLHEVRLSREKVAALQAHLDGQFAAAESTRVESADSDLSFVHHPEKYCYFHNSNGVLAAWLERAAAKVRGMRLVSTWAVR